VLGICYGAQLLALQHGGSLHHHLPFDRPDGDEHRLPEDGGRHTVLPAPGSRLAALVGEAAVAVNSLHHQAVARPGAGMRACARAPDGVIEAIEAADGSFVLGVQWHPERLDGPAGVGLIAALVAASARG
jgi:putative glutamine amidotransferase